MKLLKKVFKEQNIVVILFVMVLIAYSYVQAETRKLDKALLGSKVKSVSSFAATQYLPSAHNSGFAKIDTLNN
ncbi:MAG: hypothetical protein QM764_14460 [Chitinophagaceae bacterium]